MFDVYAAVSVLAAAFDRDTLEGEPEYGRMLRRLERDLDDVAAELDPALWPELS